MRRRRSSGPEDENAHGDGQGDPDGQPLGQGTLARSLVGSAIVVGRSGRWPALAESLVAVQLRQPPLQRGDLPIQLVLLVPQHLATIFEQIAL